MVSGTLTSITTKLELEVKVKSAATLAAYPKSSFAAVETHLFKQAYLYEYPAGSWNWPNLVFLKESFNISRQLFPFP